MINKNFSFSEAFGDGWDKLKANWFFLVGASVVIFAVSGVFGYLSDGPYHDIEPTSGLLAIIGLLVRIWLNFNFLVITIRLFDGQEPKWADLFVWREETIAYIGASIVYGLIIFLSALFLIIPGIYFAVKYCFYGFLIADKRMGAMAALKASSQMTDNVKWLLVGFGFASAGIMLLGVLAFGIGLLVAIPIVSIALVFVYRSLFVQTFGQVVASAGPNTAIVASDSVIPDSSTVNMAPVSQTNETPAVIVTPPPEKTKDAEALVLIKDGSDVPKADSEKH